MMIYVIIDLDETKVYGLLNISVEKIKQNTRPGTFYCQPDILFNQFSPGNSGVRTVVGPSSTYG